MRVFSLRRDQLTLLDASLEGRLSDALAAVAREDGDPILTVERVRPPDGSPSLWFLHVIGGSQPFRFAVTDRRVLGVIAHVYLVDHIEDLKAELRWRVTGRQTTEQLDFDHPWPRRHQGDPS